MLELIPLTVLSVIMIAIVIWLKKKNRDLRKAINYHSIASGAHYLLKTPINTILSSEVKVSHEAELVKETQLDLEKIIRVMFGYGGLIKRALEMESFTLSEIASAEKMQEMLVNAWIRDCLDLGILEEYEDNYTGEIRYKIRKEKIDELTTEILSQLHKLKEK